MTKLERLREGNEYDGGVIPDEDLLEIYPLLEWRVAEWREKTFGVPWAPSVHAAIDLFLHGAHYLSGHGGNPYWPDSTLPSGTDRSWMRGTWAHVPVSWLHREMDLRCECDALAERDSA
jgi:hypothetical protein